MDKWECTVCGWIYDPAENNNVPFEDLPDDWVCPECGAGKDMFEKMEEGSPAFPDPLMDSGRIRHKSCGSNFAILLFPTQCMDAPQHLRAIPLSYRASTLQACL